MKVVILYRARSEHATKVEAFVRDFAYRYQDAQIDPVDADSREGVALSGLYGIMAYPAILALRDDGTLLKHWDSALLPLIDEVAYYTLRQ